MKIEKLENPFMGLDVGYGLSLDDVIRKVNEIIDALNGKEDPELRESEDERIRKGIISLVLKVMGQEKDSLSDDKYDAMLAYLEKQKEQKPVELSEKHIADVFEKVGLSKIVREIGNDDLTNAVQSAMIELSKGNSKEWSEGDEKHLNYILDAIDYWGTTSGQAILLDADINWLKSIRPCPSWKPSKEQMKALESCFCEFGEGCPDEEGLRSLYNDLKRL